MHLNLQIKQFIATRSIHQKVKKFKRKFIRNINLDFTTWNSLFLNNFIVFLIDQNEQNRQTLEFLSKNHLINMSQ